MKYLSEILWILSLPLLIFISYKLIRFALKRLEGKQKDWYNYPW